MADEITAADPRESICPLCGGAVIQAHPQFPDHFEKCPLCGFTRPVIKRDRPGGCARPTKR